VEEIVNDRPTNAEIEGLLRLVESVSEDIGHEDWKRLRSHIASSHRLIAAICRELLDWRHKAKQPTR
jgi:hypothetical protein